METPKKPKKKQKATDLSAVRIKAGAIHFDKHGNVLVDPEVQAEAADFGLPPWVGGGGDTEPGIVVACPDIVTACAPETVCGDVGCEPEGICTDAGCEPESVCTDFGCEPEGICSDVACGNIACEPESICSDAQCEPESKCVDIFCKEKNRGCEINMECGGGPPTMEDFGSS